MKRISLYSISVITLLILLTSCKDSPTVYTIKGKLIDVERPYVMLLRLGDDLSFGGIEIPVVNGEFTYTDTIAEPEVYNIYLQKHGGRPQNIVLEEGEITVTLHDEKNGFENNLVNGGKLNNELNSFNKYVTDNFIEPSKPLFDSLDVLYMNNEYYSDTVYKILDKLKASKSYEEKKHLYKIKDDIINSGIGYSEKGKVLNNKMNEHRDIYKEGVYNYISQNHNTISYFLIYKDLYFSREHIDTTKVMAAYKVLSKKMPNHPYNKPVSEIINSLTNIKVGGKFIDFSAPDLNGKEIKISDVIHNKIAIIDLWATTCGPCISTSKSYIPIYEKYKNKGFTVVGIAGEHKNTDRLKTALDKYKFPWINLVELDNERSIWNKYGIPNAAGKTFLVDKDGTILAIAPTAKEVEQILNEKLK